MVRLPDLNSSYVNNQKYFMLFETKLCDRGNFMSYLFVNPIKIIKAENFKDVERAFNDIEECSKKFYLAGYFAYELGYYFEQAIFKNKNHSRIPLIHLAVFDQRFYFNHKTGDTNINNPELFSHNNPRGDFLIRGLKLNITPKEYRDKVLKIKKYIRDGDTYQVNFTAKYNFHLSGSILSLYNELSRRQQVQYSAFCKFGNQHIISLSPELFLRRNGSKIYSQPMKGTMRRGRDAKENRQNVIKLKESLKNRAENLMIIDLVRNDLGRVSKVNSVKVSEAFRIRKYETILQMTSQVNSTLRSKATYFDIFKNIFPGGSVTGAPKIRTMQIIKELEVYPRGVYCGALGFISKGKQAVFNLPIRTISVSGKRGEMGVGSGIVYDSSPSEELKECKLKARFFIKGCNSFNLIETIAWDRKYKFFKEHLRRMKISAGYFGFLFKPPDIRNKLREIERELVRGRQYRIRLLLDSSGNLESESSIIKRETGIKYVAISKYKTNPESVFSYHKTTNRALYDQEYSRYRSLGYFEVIFLNIRDEVAEGAISNVIIEKGNALYTPPISSGLLAGIYRGYLLKKRIIKEKVISLQDLLRAEKVFLCNSVRGMKQVELKIEEEFGQNLVDKSKK